jgi:beta-lactamase regulating signal transducer with metallopeptidase domain
VFPPVLVLAAIAGGTALGAATLASARWPYRSPGAAILLWQALGLSWGLAAVGALAALGAVPGRYGVAGGALSSAAGAARSATLGFRASALIGVARLAVLTASAALFVLLVWVLVAASAAVLVARRRHRILLTLLAHGDPKVPGALVVDHPAAAAYCVPGLRSRIVISAGTLDLLDAAELAAVLAHERAHLRARHDLVLLPFSALGRAFPRSRLVCQAYATVALLVEMLADDRALRQRPARELATALLRVGTSGAGLAPSGALAAAGTADAEVTARVARLLTPQARLPLHIQALVCCTAALLVAVPVTLLLHSF